MSADDPFEAIKQTFFLECEELLTDLEASVTALTFGDGDGETINAAFRAIHSIKGGAGAFGLEELVRYPLLSPGAGHWMSCGLVGRLAMISPYARCYTPPTFWQITLALRVA